MSLRDLLQKPAVGGGAAAALIVGAVVYTVFFSGPDYTGPKVETAYHYYDLKSKQFFEGPMDKFSPIAAPSGGEGVRAYVFSCSDCADTASRFTAYLFKNSEAAKKLLEDSADMTGGANYKAWYDGQLVSKPEGGEWVNIHSPEGVAIAGTAKAKCGEKAVECRIEK
jgi:hypothetical protein